MRKVPLIVGGFLLLASCAPQYSGSSSKPDSALNCQEITAEIAKANSVKAEAQSNKGLSGQNVAWALLFWPGIFINESNNNEVIRRVDDRITKLNELYAFKKCTEEAPPAPQASTENK